MTTPHVPTLPHQNSSGASNAHAAPYVPHDLKYSASFEDSLIDVVLHPPSPLHPGLRVIADDSDEQAVPGRSVRAADIVWDSLPSITEEELPLPLDDRRRVFASPIPGVKLTHPGGYLEGGPGLEPEMDTFPDGTFFPLPQTTPMGPLFPNEKVWLDFFANQHPRITTSSQLDVARQREVEQSLSLLKERLRGRQEAKERNERVGRELKTLVDQHEMEVKIQMRMAEDQRRKKESKESRRRDGASGSGGG